MQNRTVQLAATAVAFAIIGIIGGFLLGNAIFAGGGEASEEISSPTLDPNVTPTPDYSDIVATNEALSAELAEVQEGVTALGTLEAELDTLIVQATEAATQAMGMAEDATAAAEEMAGMAEDATEVAMLPTETPIPPTETPIPPTETPVPPTATAQPAGQRVLYRIVPAESEVRFNIDETLNGERITVVGATDQVAADIVVDFGNPDSSQLGTIRINVRTLQTDNNFRDQAIRGRILESSRDEYEFAEFVPTDLDGLPETVAIGDTVTFTVIGDLTLKDVTRSVSFEAEVTIEDADTMTGIASATILYRDFGLTIPDVPAVSDVADEVILEIEFVAARVEV